jgi:hypothetical protein
VVEENSRWRNVEETSVGKQDSSTVLEFIMMMMMMRLTLVKLMQTTSFQPILQDSL